MAVENSNCDHMALYLYTGLDECANTSDTNAC